MNIDKTLGAAAGLRNKILAQCTLEDAKLLLDAEKGGQSRPEVLTMLNDRISSFENAGAKVVKAKKAGKKAEAKVEAPTPEASATKAKKNAKKAEPAVEAKAPKKAPKAPKVTSAGAADLASAADGAMATTEAPAPEVEAPAVEAPEASITEAPITEAPAGEVAPAASKRGRPAKAPTMPEATTRAKAKNTAKAAKAEAKPAKAAKAPKLAKPELPEGWQASLIALDFTDEQATSLQRSPKSVNTILQYAIPASMVFVLPSGGARILVNRMPADHAYLTREGAPAPKVKAPKVKEAPGKKVKAPRTTPSSKRAATLATTGQHLRRVFTEEEVDSLPRRIPEVAHCVVPGCEVHADNYEDIKRLFGVRVMENKEGVKFLRHQPRCKPHRGKSGVGVPSQRRRKHAAAVAAPEAAKGKNAKNAKGGKDKAPRKGGAATSLPPVGSIAATVLGQG